MNGDIVIKVMMYKQDYDKYSWSDMRNLKNDIEDFLRFRGFEGSYRAILFENGHEMNVIIGPTKRDIEFSDATNVKNELQENFKNFLFCV